MVAAGCFFLLYLIMGGFCIVWRNRYLVKLGEVLGSLIAVVVCVAVTCALSFITCGGSIIALWIFFFDLVGLVLSLSFCLSYIKPR